MKDIVIASAVRTPIGAFGKSLKDVPAVELGALVVRHAVERAGLPASAVDEVIMGNVLSAGLGQNVARQMAIGAGIPRDTPSFTVNKVCGSGLRSVSLAVQILKAGDASCIVAGGAENMSQAPHLLAGNRWGTRLGHGTVLDSMLRDGLHDAFDGYPMGETAENIAVRWDISRTEQDAYALKSQRRAAKAIADGAFRGEIVPVPLLGGRGAADSFSVDEHPRKVSAEKLAALEPIFRSGGTVTAGNSSGINDGAAALVLMTRNAAEQAGVPMLATVRGYASAGVDPGIMGYGPVPATRNALAASDWKVDDVDLVELNEAFASQSLAVMRELGLDSAIVNVHGGAIALGHPIGCSGARVLTTLVHAMERRNARKGVATLCIGGGMGIAMCIERATGTSRNP